MRRLSFSLKKKSKVAVPALPKISGTEIRFFFQRLTFGLKTRLSLYERIEAFMVAGVDVVTTLRTIRNRYRGRRSTRGKAKVLDSWIRAMERGGTFSDAIKAWVPSSEHMLISSGERGEGIISGLQEARVLSEATARSKAAIYGGTIFPGVLFAMIIGMLIMFQVQMVPIFEGLLPVERWPGSAQTLNSLSAFMKNQLYLVIGGFLATSAIIGYSMPRWRGDIRTKVFDKLPPWSIYRSYQASSFLISLSSLMKAGVANYDALRLMHRNASPWMQQHLEKMMTSMRHGGENQGKALNTGLLDQEVAGDIEDYSQLGSFQDAIYRIGQRSLEEGVKSIQIKMDVLKNVLLFAVAGSIVWIYLTSYGLQTTIANQANSMRY